MELYTEKGEKASIFDVCKWWIEKYPEDVFVNEPEEIVKIRELMQEILQSGGEDV